LKYEEVRVNRETRSNLVIGLILIILGGWFLAGQFVPQIKVWINAERSWPLFVIGAGLLLLVIGLLAQAAEMAIPACIVGGIGGLLYWQNATGNWESWAYVWTLIPGFVGVGIILAGLLRGQGSKVFRAGLGVILVSLVLFVIFGYFLGGETILGPYWPVLLILLGLWLLLKPWIKRQ
jgi:hypothetical protein